MENENDEMIDVDVTEMFLNDEEINELISKLNELKRTKKQIEFEIDEENDLVIHHEDEEGENE